MLPATPAKLLLLQPFGRRLAVLGRRVVPLFAITALQRNNFSGHCSLLISMQNEELRIRSAFHSAFIILTSAFLITSQSLLLHNL
jgi:hypothetical protein